MERMISGATLTLAVSMLVWLPPLAAQADDGPHWATVESFAISATPSGGRYPVVTYIPRSLLLFVKEDVAAPLGDDFVVVETQDGVEAQVIRDFVSTQPLADALGKPTIIFNTPHEICRALLCDANVDDEMLSVAAGEFFFLSDESGGVMEIFGLRNGQRVQGYLARNRFEELNRRGVITRGSENHPRLSIRVAVAEAPNTPCGSNSDSTQIFNALSSVDEQVFASLDAVVSAAAGGLRVSSIPSYGGSGEAVEFRIYTISDGWEDAIYVYTAQVTYQCQQSALGSTNTLISSVLLEDSKDNRISLSDFGTPPDLYTVTGAPYLFSVNSTRQYAQLMEILGARLPNRAIAGFFLSEFNRSCASAHRKTDQCSSYHLIGN